MRRRIGLLLSVLTLAFAAGAALAPAAWAEDHDFRLTFVARLTSIQQVGGQLIIETEGGGFSPLLGATTITGTVVQEIAGDPCHAYEGDLALSTSEGTIEAHIFGLVCGPPDQIDGAQISGAWYVTGGTGAFTGASGSGVELGKASLAGGVDPGVVRLDGTLSY